MKIIIILFAICSVVLSSCGGTSDTERTQEDLKTELQEILEPVSVQPEAELDSAKVVSNTDSSLVSE
ncbi:MAG: hypothetical protein ACPGEG_05445 [Salibacteraceae bacterium]